MKNEPEILTLDKNTPPVPPEDGPDGVILTFIGALIIIMWFMFLFEPYLVGCH